MPPPVQIVTAEPTKDGLRVMAMVEGRKRTYVVDRNPAWSEDWLCTCAYGPDCSHIRAVKAQLEITNTD